MVSKSNPDQGGKRRRLMYILLSIYVFSYLMTNGPGTFLVNKAEFFLGLPYLYIWLLFWWVVQIACVATACLKLWKPTELEGGAKKDV